ncbi:PHP domain-like protein [Trametopsis cervina]|nr:PHP domain-like protein [Trametopsis cervina]
MYIDLNVYVPALSTALSPQAKKGKGKQPQQAQSTNAPTPSFTPAEIASIESRIDVLEHLGYTILALNQTIQKKIDPKTHVNTLVPLLPHLRKRPTLTLLKRLTIVLDEESEKGCGLTSGNLPILAPYDIIALIPTTATTFSQACLSYSGPSNMTAHIISLPLTLPRLPFNLKHTMVRTAIKNGAVFEIPYTGALGGDPDPAVSGTEGGTSAKRNWWAAAREVVRVTKGKGIVVTSAGRNVADLRAPRDVGNLITMLDLGQNEAHDACTKTPQSLVRRAQTRKTYRAVLSEPKIVIPTGSAKPAPNEQTEPEPETQVVSADESQKAAIPIATPSGGNGDDPAVGVNGKKRPRNEDESSATSHPAASGGVKKKKKQAKRAAAPVPEAA